MEIIKSKIPDLADEYNELTFMDILFGARCPLEERLGGKIYG